MVTREMMEKAWDTLVKRVETELIPAALELKKAHDEILSDERLRFMHDAMRRNEHIKGITYPTKINVCGDEESNILIGRFDERDPVRCSTYGLSDSIYGKVIPISNLWRFISEGEPGVRVSRHLCGLHGYPCMGSIMKSSDSSVQFHCYDDSQVHNRLVMGMKNFSSQMTYLKYLSCEGLKTFASEVEAIYNRIVAVDDDDTRRFVEMFGISESNRKQISITVTVTEK